MDGTLSQLLLVDDNEINLFLITDLIQELGASTIVAESGQQALEFAKEHRFSAIITAIQLPDMNAYQLLNRLQADLATSGVPVVFLLPSLGHRSCNYLESDICPAEVVHLPLNKILFQGKLSQILKQQQRYREVMRFFEREFMTRVGPSKEPIATNFCQGRGLHNAGFLLLNEQGEIIHAHASTIGMLRSSLSELVGLYFETLISGTNAEAISSWRKSLLFQNCSKKRVTMSEQVTLYRSDGSQLLTDLIAHPLQSQSQALGGAHSLLLIAPAVLSNRKTHHHIGSSTPSEAQGSSGIQGIGRDPLTGLDTLSGLTEALNVALSGQAGKLSNYDQHAVTLMLINLDHFDYLNESIGQENGDKLLKAVAQRLSNCMPLEAKLARLRGDEFALLLPPQNSTHHILRVARALKVIFSNSFLIAGNEVYTSASFGIAITPEAGATPAQLLRNATRAMKKAKQQGAGGVELYSADSVLTNVSHMERQSELRSAIPAQRFRLRFREMKGLANGEIVGQIAELYWQTEDAGLQSLNSFRELAEHAGLMPEIGIWLLDNACREYMSQRRQWRPGCRLVVNIPVSFLLDKRFLTSLEVTLQQHQFPASLLQLQLREAELNRNHLRDIVAVIRELDRPEMRIAIDDFGSNFLALLQYLCDTATPNTKSIDLDCLTLGTEFLNTLATLIGNSSAQFMVSSVMGIAQDYGLDIAIDNAAAESAVFKLVSDAVAMGWSNTVYFSEPLKFSNSPLIS